MDLKEILVGLKKCGEEDYKDDRTVESVRNNLIKAISSDSRISGRHHMDDGIILMMDTLFKSSDFREALEGIAKIILNLFPVEKKEEKPQE